jgi:hypothetical protein
MAKQGNGLVLRRHVISNKKGRPRKDGLITA